MERQRSPSYPSLSLEQAIELVGKIHKANRTNVISRETAAKDMGYNGLTGRSLTVLGSLAQYGLVEKAGKGDIKVSRRAVEILHPIEESHRAEAIIQAALAPALFQMLHERFSEGVPSENALRSFLIQQSFNDVAIGPAISAFLDTNAFAEKAKVSERNGAGHGEPEESPSLAPMNLDPVMIEALAAHANRHAPSPPPTPSEEGELNKPVMNIRGDQVMISGLFDLKGLRMLEKRIAGLKALMAPDDDEDDDPHGVG